ncbi:FtsB family cell division protein [Lacticigenium naphthae]|uniref:FtsB family cell division protein n=1 Tax=Lacticigenium naphthae TaxID=515351 RepID=UPI0003FB0124|nr:septum formation initiator family protein [Lacticigenium naphthae]
MKERIAEIIRLDNEFIKEKTLQAHRQRKIKRTVQKRALFIFSIGFFFIIFLASKILDNNNKVDELTTEKGEAKIELASVKQYQDDLDYYANLLEDEDYIVKLARSEYYMTKENEIVFSFPDDKTAEFVEVTQEAKEKAE